jgi:hypothetical protein
MSVIVFIIITLCPVRLHNLKPCYLLSDVLGSLGPTDTADFELGFHAFFLMCPENLLLISIAILLSIIAISFIIYSFYKGLWHCGNYFYNLHFVLLSSSTAQRFGPCKSKDFAITQQNLNINISIFFCHFAINMYFELPQHFTAV